MLGAAPIMEEAAQDPNERLDESAVFRGATAGEEVYRSVCGMKYEVTNRLADYWLKGGESPFRSRADGKSFSAPALLALTAGVEPGCASLGFTGSRLGVDESLGQPVVKRRLKQVPFPAKILTIPMSAMANFDEATPGPPTRQTAVACVRCFALGVEVQRLNSTPRSSGRTS